MSWHGRVSWLCYTECSSDVGAVSFDQSAKFSIAAYPLLVVVLVPRVSRNRAQTSSCHHCQTVEAAMELQTPKRVNLGTRWGIDGEEDDGDS